MCCKDLSGKTKLIPPGGGGLVEELLITCAEVLKCNCIILKLIFLYSLRCILSSQVEKRSSFPLGEGEFLNFFLKLAPKYLNAIALF